MTSRDKWKRAGAMANRPTGRGEQEKMDAAKAERAKGRREVVTRGAACRLLVATFLLGLSSSPAGDITADATDRAYGRNPLA